MLDKECELIIENFPIGFLYLKGELDIKNKLNDFSVHHINSEFGQFFGIDRQLFLDKKLSQINDVFPFNQNEFIPILINICKTKEKIEFNQYHDKLKKWLKISVYSPKDNEIALFFSDITQSILPLNDANILFNITSDLIAISDLNGVYLVVNQVWTNYYGYNTCEVEQHYAWEFVLDEDCAGFKNMYAYLRSANESMNYTNQLRHQNGNSSYIEWSSQRHGDRIYSVGRDVTERINRGKEIEYLSYHDVLTGLLNRRFLEEEMKRLDTARNLPISLIMCDVNRLKLVNDAFGHEKGDELIKYAARALQESCRPEDLVARWGGDEFIIFLPKTSYEDAKKILARIKLNCLKYDINSIYLSIACGLCTKNDSILTIEDLLRSSEDAMYREKSVESERNRRDMIDVIAQALYQKSPYEEAHAKRVSLLCHYLAQALKCSKEDIQKAEIAGLFHDIGKVAISSDILLKQGKLNEFEWEIVKQHTEIGSKVVGESLDMREISRAILHHHERYDGKGYPSGKKWDEIPLLSRIISLSEAFDSIHQRIEDKSSDSLQCAIDELRKNKQTQFDPFITEIFIKDVVEKLFKPSQ